FFFSCFGLLPPLHSFPTRRSSDLGSSRAKPKPSPRTTRRSCSSPTPQYRAVGPRWCLRRRALDEPPGTLRASSSHHRRDRDYRRSEEHTSELQSRGHLVCRLLLEK